MEPGPGPGTARNAKITNAVPTSVDRAPGSSEPTNRHIRKSTITSDAPNTISYKFEGGRLVTVYGCAHADGGECGDAGKHPVVKWRTYPWPTTNPEVILEYWRRHPQAGIGIALAHTVLDFDRREDRDGFKVAAERGWIPPRRTWAALTGSGGGHWHIDIESRNGTLRGEDGKKLAIDIKGAGGYVVAPPSIHRNGRRYAWIPGLAPGEVPLAPAPRWFGKLVELVKTGAGRASYQGRAVPGLNSNGTRDHTPAEPCEVCDGHRRMPHHKGLRCYGFTHGLTVACTREQHAGELPDANAEYFVHRLGGQCGCGLEHPLPTLEQGGIGPLYALAERALIVGTDPHRLPALVRAVNAATKNPLNRNVVDEIAIAAVGRRFPHGGEMKSKDNKVNKKVSSKDRIAAILVRHGLGANGSTDKYDGEIGTLALKLLRGGVAEKTVLKECLKFDREREKPAGKMIVDYTFNWAVSKL